MKLIDALQKIADGEEVDFKIECSGEKYSLVKGFTLLDERDEEVRWYIDEKWLNNEIEIIEEPKKIEKIRIGDNSINIDKAFETGTTTFFREKDIDIFQCLSSKINEIIDYINNMEE